MSAEARRRSILRRLIDASSLVSVVELAHSFSVSERTVRYDLRLLEGRGAQFEKKPGKSGGVRYLGRSTVAAHRSGDEWIGYRRQLTTLQNLGAAARTGRGAVVVLTGEAGVGKTRLCREFAARLDHKSTAVYSISGQQFTAHADLQPWGR